MNDNNTYYNLLKLPFASFFPEFTLRLEIRAGSDGDRDATNGKHDSARAISIQLSLRVFISDWAN